MDRDLARIAAARHTIGPDAELYAARNLEVSGHCAPHQHLAVAAATPNLRHLEWFHDHVRIESMLFEGACAVPSGGNAAVNRTDPGNGLAFKDTDADRYRVA